ncbi:hypothetical protein PG301_16940 [Parageobacillus sp. G301]|nr:hypothetical protein PG301_16940 [Parageobacillus sp. G301]
MISAMRLHEDDLTFIIKTVIFSYIPNQIKTAMIICLIMAVLIIIPISLIYNSIFFFG